MGSTPPGPPALAREIGLFGATMLVMGGIVGLGHLHEPLRGGAAGRARRRSSWPPGASAGSSPLAGAFVYAELASLRPAVGGQYAYLREAFSPRVAFLYGWALLLVTPERRDGRGGRDLRPLPRRARGRCRCPRRPWPSLALAALTAVNCLGVRAGNDVQSLLHGAEDRRHPRPRGGRLRGLRRRARRAAARARPAAVLRPRGRLRRRPRARALRLRRLADLGLRDGRAEAARARHAARAPARRRRRRGALPLGERRLPARARAPTASPRARAPATDVMRLALGERGRAPHRASASRSRPSASSPRAS